jgi:ABC-type phosphate transport system permease subunit
MNFLDYNISQNRFRTDTAFKWCVRFSGILVLLVFIALILTLVYRASPLLYSPQVSLSKQLILPPSHKLLAVGSSALTPPISYANDPTTHNVCRLSVWEEQAEKHEEHVPISSYSLKCDAGIKVVEYNATLVAFYIDGQMLKALSLSAGKFVPAVSLSRRLPKHPALDSMSNATLVKHVNVLHDSLIIDTNVGIWRSSLAKATEFSQILEAQYLPNSDYSVLDIAQANQSVFSQGSDLLIAAPGQPSLVYPLAGELIALHPSRQPNVFFAQILESTENTLPQQSLLRFSLNHTAYSGLTLDAVVLMSSPYLAESNTRLRVGENDIHNIINIIAESETNSILTMLNSVTLETLTKFTLPQNESDIQFAQFNRDGFVIGEGAQLSRFAFSQLTSAITYAELFLPQTYIGYSESAEHWQTNPSLDYQDRKYNVMPLLIGSAKVSLLALLVAIPLALGCAVYVGYFAPAMVQKMIKPFIEILEAIPSVAIGLIAAVWLAPLAESFLLSFIMFLCLLPLVLLVAHGCFKLSTKFGVEHFFSSSELALQIVLILGLVWLCFIGLAAPMETLLINFQAQIIPMDKSTLVVGIAMGIAISPTIFSLAEDALSGVPRSMIKAAAALGATRLQTLNFVVLPAAAPGLIAAMMIGLGRAFGETMIVLMVTGNTPIANWDIFAGVRALSANLVIELPEANQTNSHLTVLFITALLLFLFTFCLNSIAELIKHKQSKMLRGANE